MKEKLNILECKNNFYEYKELKSILRIGKVRKCEVLISIVIPTYKRALLLKDAIDSALSQMFNLDYEVLVIDNENEFEIKTDTEKLIETYNSDKLYYYKNEKNLGMTGNWNRGIDLARGKWITILHDDDILSEDFLEKMFCVINQNDKIDLLTSSYFKGEQFDANVFNYTKKSNLIKKINIYDLIQKNITAFPGIIFKKSIALELGGFEDKYYPCADYVFWINFALKYNVYKYYEKLAFYRTFDSVTLKGDTLYNMVMMTQKIRDELTESEIGNKLYKKMINYTSIYSWKSFFKKTNIERPKEFKKNYIIRTIFRRIIEIIKEVAKILGIGYEKIKR